MGVHERIASAISGGNLREGVDLDTVIALGWAWTPADALFWRKYGSTGHERFDSQARAYVHEQATQLAQRGRWDWSEHKVSVMADTVYDFWLDDTCRACSGRAFVLPEGSPYLSDVACSACDPTRPGRRPPPWVARQRMMMRRLVGRSDARRQVQQVDAVGTRHKALLCRLELVESNSGERVLRALGVRTG